MVTLITAGGVLPVHSPVVPLRVQELIRALAVINYIGLGGKEFRVIQLSGFLTYFVMVNAVDGVLVPGLLHLRQFEDSVHDL